MKHILNTELKAIDRLIIQGNYDQSHRLIDRISLSRYLHDIIVK